MRIRKWIGIAVALSIAIGTMACSGSAPGIVHVPQSPQAPPTLSYAVKVSKETRDAWNSATLTERRTLCDEVKEGKRQSADLDWICGSTRTNAEYYVITPTPMSKPTTKTNTASTPGYIWIPNYADPYMADKLINSYPATVISVCTGIFGRAWSPATDPYFWETFDICAVNAQSGFPDPTGVATKGCVSSASGCKKYQLRR